MNQFYLHIGYYKTGTSFLQEKIFPKMNNIFYLNPIYEDNYDRPFTELMMGDFHVPSRKSLLSLNALSGMPFSLNRTLDKYHIINRLAQYYPKAKILVVERLGKDWIYSCYNEYIKSGGFRSFKYWMKNIIDLDYINHRFTDHIQASFKNVRVINFDALKWDNYNFIKDIADFLKVKMDFDIPMGVVNQRYSKYDLALIKVFNGLGLTGRQGNPYRRWKGR